MADIPFTMKRYNGSSYDTLYPATIQKQVTDLQQQIFTRNVTIPASGWRIGYDKKSWVCWSSTFDVESGNNMVDVQADITTQLQLAEDGVYGIYAQFLEEPSENTTTTHGYPYFTVIGSIPPQHDITLQISLSSIPYSSSWPDKPIGIPIMTGVAPTVFDPTLNNNTWAQIHKAADLSLGANFWAVGDRKEVTLNGSVGITTQRTFSNQKYWVYIIGFDHNKDKEGIGIAFQGFKTAQTGGIDIAVTSTNYSSTGSGMVMNTTVTNSGGWNSSAAHSTIMPQWKGCLPVDLQAVIRTTTLYTDNVAGGDGSIASNVTAGSDTIYYLSEYEAFGSISNANTYEAAQQAQYAYYAAGNSKIKYRSDSTGTAANWWLRSPNSSSGGRYCYVYTSGSASTYSAYYSLAAAPCFKV